MGEKILMFIEKEWAEFKSLVSTKILKMQYEERDTKYYLWASENGDTYECFIRKYALASTDQEDFEDNYKASCNASIQPLDADGKFYVRAESRPLGMTTCFTSKGDSDTGIGDGTPMCWNFADADNDVTPPSGFKRKLVEFKFLDTIRIKEGSTYWENATYGSYINLYIVCPAGQYYLANDKTPRLASEDTIIDNFVMHQRMLGDCTIGDELNTEAASGEIPNTYKFWIEITVPDTNSACRGHANLEIFRERTRILP